MLLDELSAEKIGTGHTDVNLTQRLRRYEEKKAFETSFVVQPLRYFLWLLFYGPRKVMVATVSLSGGTNST